MLYNQKMKEKVLLIFLFVLAFMIFVKSLANIYKAYGEIKNPPTAENIETCPTKNNTYFKGMKNGEYLYALYKYKSLGVKCKK